MDVLKIAAIAISGVLLALLLKQVKPEYSVFLSAGAYRWRVFGYDTENAWDYVHYTVCVGFLQGCRL